MTKTPFVSINILNYNNKSTIVPCLRSALEQSYDKVEVNLIDNNSSDDSLEQIKKEFPDHPRLKIIENKENLGFATGHNKAIEKSNGEFVVCLNSDAILDKDFVKNSILDFGNPDIGAVQGKLLGYDFETNQAKKKESFNIVDTTGLLMLKNRRILNRGQGFPDKGQFEKPEFIFGPDGAAPIFRKNALEEISVKGEYFDEDFFLYKEDVDLSWRMRLYGWETLYQPKAVAYHGRTAGESAAISYLKIIKERRKIKLNPKYYSFKNQRLMQIKNELPLSFLKNFPRWLFKEVGAWGYVAFFETRTLKCIPELIRQMPGAWKKRKVVMRNKRVGWREMEKWFNKK